MVFRSNGTLSMTLAVTISLGIIAGAWGAQTTPPPPGSGDFDWVQFTNGEWIKGEIKDLQDESFTFESDLLDTLQIDWEDIHALYSAKQNTVVFDERTSVQGTLRIDGNDVTVITADGERHYDRADVRGIIPGGLTEWDYWYVKWSVGIVVRSGNVDQSDLTSALTVQRRSPGLRTRLDSAGAYGSFEGVQTTNNQTASLRHDIFLTRRLHVQPSLQYYRDKFANIAYRLTPGASLGYDIVDRGAVEWNASVGGGYQYTKFDGVEADADRSEEGGTLLLGTDFSWDLTSNVEFVFRYNSTVGVTEALSTDHIVVGTLSFDLWKNLDLDLSLRWDRVGAPQQRPDGSTPKNDDLRMTVEIGWEF